MLRNAVKDIEFESPKGLDTTSPLINMQPGYIRTGDNTRLGLLGGYSKRPGFLNQLSTPYGSRDITWGIEFKFGATRRTIVFGTDGSATGGRYGYNSAGTVVDITTGLSGTRRPSMVQFGELLFFFNGGEQELYDGTATRQIGITAPTGFDDTDLSGSSGGDLIPEASYGFAYTYYNSTTGAESSPSEIALIELGALEDAVDITLTAGDSSTADTIRVYRTYANGNTLYLDGENSISDTTYTSTVEDGGLGQQMELDNGRIDDLSPQPKFPTVAQNRLFLMTGTNEVRWSKIGQNGPMPESFEVTGFERTVGKFGAADNIVGLNRISQLPIVLKELSIGRLDPIGVPDVTQAVDGVRYQYSEISDTVGAVSHWAACQVLGELVFLSKDNIYATNGSSVRPIADTIQATIQSLGFTETQKPRMSAINDTENKLVKISVFSDGSSIDPDLVLVGDYRFYPEFRWTIDKPGPTAATHPGKAVGSFFQVTNVSTGKLNVWFGNVKANGKAYRDEFGTNDDGSAIYFNIITRPYFAQNPLELKLFKVNEVQAQTTEAAVELTIGSIFDLSGVQEDLRPFELETTAYLYDALNSLYDVATYGESAVSGIQYDMHRRAKYCQMIYRQTEANKPIELFAWITQASQLREKE